MNEAKREEEIEELCDTPEIWLCTVEDLAEVARAYLAELKRDIPEPDDFEIVEVAP